MKKIFESLSSTIIKTLIIVFAYNSLSSFIIYNIIPKNLVLPSDLFGTFKLITLLVIVPSLILSLIIKFLSKGKYTFSFLFLCLSLIGISMLLVERIFVWGI